MAPAQTLLIRGAHLLTSEGWENDSTLLIEDGCIAAIGEAAERAVAGHPVPVVEAHGRWILPGIIDLHGDAFERDITPRAGTQFPLELALSANDANLVAHGITTFFYSITDGFEPGPRSRETVRRLLTTLEALSSRFACQSRIHIRHEKVNTEHHEELMDWIAQGRIHMLSLNDHLPPMDLPAKVERYVAGLQRRVTMSEAETESFLAGLQAARPLGEAQTRELVAQAARHGVILASHDDESLADVERNQILGTRIAEFPMCEPVATATREAGMAVLMGAPNLVRGGSHVGAISVREAMTLGLVDILCSDYHYTSLFHAPFLADRLGLLPLAEAWKLVSENPARAANLGAQKGRIAVGLDADLLVLDALDGLPTSLERTLVRGREVFRRGAAAATGNPPQSNFTHTPTNSR